MKVNPAEIYKTTDGCKLLRLILLVLLISATDLHAQIEGFIYASRVEKGTVIYVITNRETVLSGKTFLYTNQPRNNLSLDYYRCTYFSPDSIVKVKLDSSAFLCEIQYRTGDWLVSVHGDNKTFKTAIWRGLDIQYKYNINVLVFSWPSKDPDARGLKNYKNSQMNLVKSYGNFIQLLLFLKKFRNNRPEHRTEQRISLFCHSLGNQYLKMLASDDEHILDFSRLFDNVILNAAAVDQKDHKAWLEKINIQKNLYVTANKQDVNLKGLHIFTKGGKQLGEKITHPLASNAVYIHFNKSVGLRFPTGTTHTYFIGGKSDTCAHINLFYKSIFHGKSVDVQNKVMFMKRKDGLGFEISCGMQDLESTFNN